jgi:hypothetical protein
MTGGTTRYHCQQFTVRVSGPEKKVMVDFPTKTLFDKRRKFIVRTILTGFLTSVQLSEEKLG